MHGGTSPSRSPLGLRPPRSSRDSNGAHRLSLSSSCSAASAKKALLFTEERSEALGEISLNTLNSAASVAGASSPPPRDRTPHGTGKRFTDAPRSVLRRRTPGQPAGSTGHISFNQAQTNFDPSPSSLVKHSPRPPRWPAAQSPWLHRGLEQSDDELHTTIPRRETMPKVAAGSHSELPQASRSHRTPAAVDNNMTVQDELLAMRVAYCNMCGLVLLGALGSLLYAQGLMLSQYYKPLTLAGFVGTALRRPVRYVAEMLRWSPGERAGPAPTGPQPAGEVEMPEWRYWQWLGAAYIASSLLNFPGHTATAAVVLLSLYSVAAIIVRAVQTTWIAKELRQYISDWRSVIAKLTVVTSFFLLVIIGLSLCAYNLVTELKMLRSFALDGSMHSHTVATVHAVSGWSEEEIATFVRERSVMLSDYLREQFEDMVGDKQLASDLQEQVLLPFVLEALQFSSVNTSLTHSSPGQNATECDMSSASAREAPTSGCSSADTTTGMYNTSLTLKSFEEIYSGAIGSSLLWSEHTQQIVSRLLVHTYRLLLEGVGYALAGIDFLFACTLFVSWLWMCLDDGAIECTIDRVLVGTDTAARFKSVLATTAGILDSLAHTFLFHTVLAWLVFSSSSVRLQWTCSLLAGLLSITPVFSPWAVIFAPLALRILTITVVDNTEISDGTYFGYNMYSMGAGSTMLSVWSDLGRTEVCAWAVAICVWVSGKTQRLLSRSIATRTHQLVGETAATQAILLGFYAFGIPGIAAGPVLLAMTNGLVKVYRDSVVFPLSCSRKID